MEEKAPVRRRGSSASLKEGNGLGFLAAKLEVEDARQAATLGTAKAVNSSSFGRGQRRGAAWLGCSASWARRGATQRRKTTQQGWRRHRWSRLGKVGRLKARQRLVVRRRRRLCSGEITGSGLMKVNRWWLG
ncbi:hypothetical protein M0R45_019537 [Rubus argutus]|uniref:Uncharacterized protein n=1 Tax=Rubus argutus TaxID=59490 RepID=A0AAW1X840_RUBAR